MSCLFGETIRGHGMKALAEVATVGKEGLARLLRGVKLGLGIGSEFVVQVCGVELLTENDGGGDGLKLASHGARGESGGRRRPDGTFSLVDAESHHRSDLGRFGESDVDVLGSNETRQVVDVCKGGTSSIGGGGEFVELFHEG